jgi:hypothetical protein
MEKAQCSRELACQEVSKCNSGCRPRQNGLVLIENSIIPEEKDNRIGSLDSPKR